MRDGESIEARYANYFQIGQNAVEFVLEFGQQYGDETVPLLHTRIITSPSYVNNLLKVLQQALAEHEAYFGPVRDA